MQRLGHTDCGVYAEIVRGGTLSEGERFTLAEPAQASLPLP
jgi:MOSC domain-containing protein YiiM